MSNHQPECMASEPQFVGIACICTRLRDAYRRGVADARGAVALAAVATGGYATKVADLAAIDEVTS